MKVHLNANHFNDAIKNSGITKYQLAKETGLSCSSMTRYANGGGTNNIQKIESIAKVLNVSVSYLIGASDKMDSFDEDTLLYQSNPVLLYIGGGSLKDSEKTKRLYRIWGGIITRCFNKKSHDYRLYGGRGITVCEAWKNAYNFINWALLNGYRDDLTLDRINTNCGYSPDNCQWISINEQQRNKRNNHVLEFNGETHCATEWAEIKGIPVLTLLTRIYKGWEVEEALLIKPSKNNNALRYQFSKEKKKNPDITLTDFLKEKGKLL